MQTPNQHNIYEKVSNHVTVLQYTCSCLKPAVIIVLTHMCSQLIGALIVLNIFLILAVAVAQTSAVECMVLMKDGDCSRIGANMLQAFGHNSSRFRKSCSVVSAPASQENLLVVSPDRRVLRGVVVIRMARPPVNGLRWSGLLTDVLARDEWR